MIEDSVTINGKSYFMMPRTEDEFMEEFLVPFEVDGVNLEDVENIYLLYRSKMLACNTLDDMVQTRLKFKFLIAGATKGVTELGLTVDDVKALFHNKKQNVSMDETHIVLPKVMLHAHIIGKEFTIPQYVAAVQYIRATYYHNPMSLTWRERLGDWILYKLRRFRKAIEWKFQVN